MAHNRAFDLAAPGPDYCTITYGVCGCTAPLDAFTHTPICGALTERTPAA